jgi:hypothetical protein
MPFFCRHDDKVKRSGNAFEEAANNPESGFIALDGIFRRNKFSVEEGAA